MNKKITALCLAVIISPAAFAEQWLTSLETKTPQEGYELAIKMSRMAVKHTQPSAEKRTEVRAKYEKRCRWFNSRSASSGNKLSNSRCSE